VDSSEVVLPPPAEPDAKFKILAASKVSELDRAKQQYSGSHLMLGVVYSRLGLLDDAERHFQALVSANPKSELARKLLQTVKSLRPKQ
jgi:tetratricopeptide (TPR) repeat protein